MSGIKLDTTFADATLPTGVSAAETILASPYLYSWLQADADHVTLAGTKIASFVDRADSVSISQGVDSRRATLVDASAGTYASAYFDAANAAFYEITKAQPDWSGPFSLVTAFRRSGDLTANNMLLGAGNTTGSSLFLGQSYGNDTLQWKLGSSPNHGLILDATVWNWAVASFDGAAVTKLSLNGGAVSEVPFSGSVPTAPNIAIGSIAPGGGSYWNGWIADILIFETDLHDAANSGLMAALANQMAVYGI